MITQKEVQKEKLRALVVNAKLQAKLFKLREKAKKSQKVVH